MDDSAPLSRRACLAGVVAVALAGKARAAPSPVRLPRREDLLIRGGAVVTMDPGPGTLAKADVLIRDGAIAGVGPALSGRGARVLDARDMIVMPGFVETHWHMWSSLGRNFIADGFEYFDAKRAASALFEPVDVYRSDRLALAEAVEPA